jgi:hypothetical protein
MDLKIPSKKKVAVGIALFVSIFCLVSLASMYFFGGSFSYTFTFFENTGATAGTGHHDPTTSYNVIVKTDINTPYGVKTTVMEAGNVITLIGAREMRDRIAFINATTPWNTTSVISLSNDDPTCANNTATILANEVTTNGFARANGTIVAWWNTTGNGNYAWNVTKMFTATGTQQLRMAGLQWCLTPLTNNLFALAPFTQTTFNSGDNCTILWVITIGSN